VTTNYNLFWLLLNATSQEGLCSFELGYWHTTLHYIRSEWQLITICFDFYLTYYTPSYNVRHVIWRVFSCTLNYNVLYLRFLLNDRCQTLKEDNTAVWQYHHHNWVNKVGIFVSYGTCPLQHSTSDAAREPSACIIRRDYQQLRCATCRKMPCVFSSVSAVNNPPYWMPCWASNDMEQGFSSEADIHFLSSSRNSPLYHASDFYFRCYSVHVELLNYYTNYCTYIKFIH